MRNGIPEIYKDSTRSKPQDERTGEFQKSISRDNFVDKRKVSLHEGQDAEANQQQDKFMALHTGCL